MSSFVAPRAEMIPHSGIREIFNLAHRMPDVVHLEIGEPDFDTPEPIVRAAEEAARSGHTHYTANAGIAELRVAIAKRLSSETGRPFSFHQILVTAGATEASLLAFLTTLSPGDQVLLPSPAWPNYWSQLQLAGAEPILIRLRESDGFEVDAESVESHLTDRTKGLVLNYPHNPTGATLSSERLSEIADVARRHNLLIYSDETYADLTYEGPSTSVIEMEGMPERVVILRTFSKTYAMTGWRIGYMAADEHIVRTATVLREHTSTCASSVSQHAAVAALESGGPAVGRMLAEYKARRDAIVEAFRGYPHASLFRPRGAFYGFVGIESFDRPSAEVALTLLHQHAVAVAPGSAFGDAGEGYLRICFARPIVELREGIARIRTGLAEMASEG